MYAYHILYYYIVNVTSFTVYYVVLGMLYKKEVVTKEIIECLINGTRQAKGSRRDGYEM